MAQQQDAINMLEADHQRVKSLFSEFQKTSDAGKRASIADRIIEELRIHTQLEEEIFYPAFHRATAKGADEHLVYESREEHHVVDLVMPEVEEEQPGSMTHSAKEKVLSDIVEHHIEEEERDMFPRMRKLYGNKQLEEMGQQMAERKQEILGEAPAGDGERAIDLNAASADELKRIEGISEVRAQDIVQYRDAHGGFADWDDLYAIEGIDDRMVERIRKELRIGG